jgi:hypothetical protein
MENFADKLKSFGQYLIDNSESLSNEFEKTERFEKSPSVPSFVGKAYMKFVLKNESISKKVNLKEFKTIIKNIIKEEIIKENQIKIDKDVIKQSAINTLKRIGNQNTTNNQKHKEAVELYDKEENKDIIDKEIKKAIKERENGSKISNALIGTRIASKINVKYNKR